jgi:hypothetical protein
MAVLSAADHQRPLPSSLRVACRVVVAAWLDAHRRAPSPDGQPCILLHPLSRAIRAAGSKGSRARRKRE